MQEIPRGPFQDRTPNRFRDEKLDRIARLVGGYIGNVVKRVGIENFSAIVQPDEFPTEVWSAVALTRGGRRDTDIRRDPYLSFAYPLLRKEDPATIYWELIAKSPDIAFYATGDLAYAQAVGDYLRSIQVQDQELSSK